MTQWRDAGEDDYTPFAGEAPVDAIVYVENDTSPELSGADQVRRAAAAVRPVGPAPSRIAPGSQGQWEPPAPAPVRKARKTKSRRLCGVLLAAVPLLIAGALVYFFLGVYSGKYLNNGTATTNTPTPAPAGSHAAPFGHPARPPASPVR